jgi:outer membrane lipoprotein SlyB
MGKPFKMKYTNGKKADSTAFPFKVEAAKPGDSPAEFNWKAAAGGALKGGATGSMLGPWGTVIGGLAGGISAGIKGDNKEETIKDKVNSKVDEKIEEKVDDVTTKEVEKQSGGAGYSGL